jgi:microcystin-dependent protein
MGGSDAGRLDLANTRGTTAGTQYHTLTTTEMPSHTHTQNAHSHTVNSHNHTETNYIASAAYGVYYQTGGVSNGLTPNTTTGNTGNSSPGTDSITATNQNTGGGGAHNNMPPAMLLNYIIKT